MAEPVSRKGAVFGTILFALMSAYFLWVALTDSPLFRLDSRFAYIGALLFGFGAVSMARTALHPETYKGPSLAYYFFSAFELAAYFVAMLAGLVWLTERFLGNATPADDIQRGGLWVLGILGVLIVLRVLGVVGPEKEKTKE